MRNELAFLVGLVLLSEPSVADASTCQWAGDIVLTAPVSLTCDHLEIDDDTLVVTNGFSLTVVTRRLTVVGEATIRSFAVLPSAFHDARKHPPRADPNWAESSSAADTLDGRNGGTASTSQASSGVDGRNGKNAAPIRIRVTEVAVGNLRILNQGGRGRRGESGEHAAGGGNAENGGRSRTGTIETPFGDVCFCEAGGGHGGNGGHGQDGGDAGKPGPGGDAGDVEVSVLGDASDFALIRVDLRGGRIGEGGLWGAAGPRGEAGFGGRGGCGCEGEVYSRMGTHGNAGGRGLEASDKLVGAGQPASFSPAGAPYANVVTADPPSNCEPSIGDPTAFWTLFLSSLKICERTRREGNALVCTVAPDEGPLKILLRHASSLSEKTAHQRGFGAPCTQATPLDQLICIGKVVGQEERIPASEIVSIPSRGSANLKEECTRALVSHLFLMQVAHTLADGTVLASDPASTSLFKSNQLVLEWMAPPEPTHLIAVDATTMEAIAYYAAKYLEWLSNGPPEAIFLSDAEVKYAPSMPASKNGEAMKPDISKETLRDVFDVSSNVPLSRVERVKFIPGMRMAMIGDSRAAILPLQGGDNLPDDSVAFCNWLALQGSYLDEGTLTALRFDGLQSGLTEMTLVGRGAVSGQVPSDLFANLLYVLSAWRTSPIGGPAPEASETCAFR